jgi:hypothetical protein
MLVTLLLAVVNLLVLGVNTLVLYLLLAPTKQGNSRVIPSKWIVYACFIFYFYFLE